MRIISACVLMCLVGCHAAREPAVSRDVGPEYEAYLDAQSHFEKELGKRFSGLAGAKRLQQQVEALVEHRDPSTVEFARELVAVLEKHGIRVDGSVKRVAASRGWETGPADVTRCGVIALAMYYGNVPGEAEVAEPTRESDMLSMQVVSDLADVITRKCPDRMARLSLLNNGTYAKDVRSPSEEEWEKYSRAHWEEFQAHRMARHAIWRGFFRSLEGSSHDPVNASVVNVFETMQGMGLGMILYYYGQTADPARGEDVREAVGMLRRAAQAAQKRYHSDAATKAIAGCLADLEKGKAWFSKYDEAVMEWNETLPTTVEFYEAIRSNSAKKLAHCCSPELRTFLEGKQNLAETLLGEKVVRSLVLESPGVPGKEPRKESDRGCRLSVSFVDEKGERSRDKAIYLTLRRYGSQWRVSGILGVFAEK